MHALPKGAKFLILRMLVLTFLCATGCQLTQTDSGAPQRFTQITNWPGTENAPSFSPDGQYVAFDAVVDGNTDIYIHELATGDVRRVTQNASTDYRPTWSPDGDRVAFISNRGGRTGIWTVANDDSNNEELYVLESGFRLSGRPLWAPDGAHIAFTLISPEGAGNLTWGRATVATVDVNTGEVTQLTSKGDEFWPAWGPKSEWLHYYVGISDDIEAVHKSTGEIRSISKGDYAGWRPVPSPDGKSILFISSIDRPSVFIAPMDGSHPPVRLTHVGADDVPSFSPNGKTIIFSNDRSKSAIVEYDLTTNRRNILATHGRRPQELSDGKVAFLSPGASTWDISLRTSSDTSTIQNVDVTPIVDFAFSPEGDKIAVVTSNDLMNNYHIQIIDRNGVSTGISLRENGKPETPVWCDDNETLLYSARETWGDGFREIWAYNNRNNSISKITTSDINKRPTQCSENAEKITYFLTMGASGIHTIKKQNDQWKEALSIEGRSGRWSPDSSLLAFTARRNGQTDIFIRTAVGEETQITDDALIESTPTWSRDGNRLLFSTVKPNRDIWMMKLPDLPWLE